MKDNGYNVYYAEGKYGRPDLEKRNYGTGHLMIYDPTPESGGDFGDEAYTRSWRKVHELSHALAYKDINAKYGEGRRIGKLGTHRTLKEAKRAVEWEWLTAMKQREISEQMGHPISDEDFAREINTVIHDAVHRVITGKFSAPDAEGFEPSDKLIPLDVAMKALDEAAAKMGLKDENSLLAKGTKTGSAGTTMKTATSPMGTKEMERLVNGPYAFRVLSAYKGAPKSKSQNQDAHGDLFAELQARGYSNGQIRTLRGQYFSDKGDMKTEKSILVFDVDFDDLLEMGQMFEQESVIYKNTDGVVGLYYTNGSSRVQFAETPEGRLALGDEAVKVNLRDKKDKRRGPPTKSELWSKARNLSFEFPLNFNRPGLEWSGGPVTRDQAERHLETNTTSARPSVAPSPTEAPAQDEPGTKVASPRRAARSSGIT